MKILTVKDYFMVIHNKMSSSLTLVLLLFLQLQFRKLFKKLKPKTFILIAVPSSTGLSNFTHRPNSSVNSRPLPNILLHSPTCIKPLVHNRLLINGLQAISHGPTTSSSPIVKEKVSTQNFESRSHLLFGYGQSLLSGQLLEDKWAMAEEDPTSVLIKAAFHISIRNMEHGDQPLSE